MFAFNTGHENIRITNTVDTMKLRIEYIKYGSNKPIYGSLKFDIPQVRFQILLEQEL